MSVTTGAHLGPYEIQDRLGVGGMGEVFRAHDTRLGRSVAIKVSAERFSERFEREARLIAALNHPNICTLYDVGPDYLVMELVEGPTLADRLAEGPMPLDEALGVARQIAEALRAAHEKGIVHRDLKPTNIKLKPDGTVKVLDFGLATATSAAATGASTADSPTFTMGSTQVGTILGTAGYMAPEQARGKPVDKRADIWAFGVVLYEMLVGGKLFEAETVSDSLANILTKEPDFNRVPFQVRRLLRSCLQKDLRQRLNDIGDALLLLDEPAKTVAVAARRSIWSWLWPILALVAAIALDVQGWLNWRATPATPESLRFQIQPPEKVTLASTGPFSLSPDGRKLVFAGIENGEQKLWIRSMDSLEARPLEGATLMRAAPMFWSPDSRFVAIEADNKLKKMDVSGGPPEDVCDLPSGSDVVGGTWNGNNVILFGETGNGIMRVSAAGGTPVPVTALDRARKDRIHGYPLFLPDGNHFLYIRWAGSDLGVYSGSLDTKPDRQNANLLFKTGSSISYVPTANSGKGRILFVRDGTLYAQTFNQGRLATEGEPQPIQQQVALNAQWLFATVSATGNDLVFRSSAGEDLQLTWLDRSGRVLGTVGEGDRYEYLVLSRDGTRSAVGKRNAAGNQDIWLMDLNTGVATRFTFDSTNNNPVWSPDGTRVIFGSLRGGMRALYEKSTNGAGAEGIFLQNAPALGLSDWSRDGRYLIFSDASTIWVLPLMGDRKPIPFLRSSFLQIGARLSPDSRWIAFPSKESGREEIYVESFTPAPDAGSAATTGKWLVSRDGGVGMIHWRQDGKELFYLAPDGGVMAVPITPGPTFHAGTPERLFNVPTVFMRSVAPGNLADVSPDGQKFLLALPQGGESSQGFTVVTNWQAALQK
jgi:eukaryotic-like serine/threonine-protein kinase